MSSILNLVGKRSPKLYNHADKLLSFERGQSDTVKWDPQIGKYRIRELGE